ncbi:MAG TPA: LLM class F420-dependent oxidoreductase [Acidimicrobiales bacterium]|nr:LLM class F420-dependent oxidoreductase [Acidimicrobiales bacterium]
MRLSTMLDYSRGIKGSLDAVVDLERAGLDIVWVAEAYGYDGVSQMGYLAARTERMEIGSAILPIYSRTPTLLAQTAAGLDAVSGGRFILGLGASGPQVIEGWHGVAYTEPLQRTREIIEICRRVWRREVLTNDGIYPIPLPPGRGTGLGKPLKLITHPERETIPIWIASMGPKNVEMTAEVADGWFPFLFIPEKAAGVWGTALGAGRARRPASLGPLEVAAGGLVAVGEGLEHLRELARGMTALYVGGMGARDRNFYNSLVRRYGYEKEAELIQDLYLDGKKEEAAAAVPTALLEETSLIGSAGYVKERIAAYREAGVTVLNVTPVGHDPLATLSQLREWV